MKTKVWALMFILAILLQGTALAGGFGRDAEEALLAEGKALQTEATFSWGGLPLLEDDLDAALESLFDVMAYRMQRQLLDDGSIQRYDLLLQNVSVLDFTMQAADDVYYEQSNLLGGQTVAFTPEAFRAFVGRISTQTDGALPANMDGLFSVVMRALQGADTHLVDAGTTTEAMEAFAAWQTDALQQVQKVRPTLLIPGLYGSTAQVTEITREEILALAEIYSALLAENDELWLDAAKVQAPGADEQQLHMLAEKASDTMRDLPEILGQWLPANIAPAEYREVFDYNDVLIAKQIEADLPGDWHIYVEWVPVEEGVGPAYASLHVGESTLSVLVSTEEGTVQQLGSYQTQRNVVIQEWSYAEPALTLDAMLTDTRNIQTYEKKEVIKQSVELMMTSEVLFGEGAVVTLSINTTDTASAEKDYVRKADTVIRLKGLGFDKQDILTIHSETKPSAAGGNDAVIASENAIMPAEMDAEAFDAWYAGVQVSTVQAMMTVLGRLPAEMAAYILSVMN